MLAAMMASAAGEKHLRTEERMEVLTEFQELAGLGFCLRVLQALWIKVRALTTLERLWLRSRRLVMRSEDGLMATVEMALIVLEGRSWKGREVHFLVGQEAGG